VKYTQLKLKPEYREKLGLLADRHNRSLANMLEWLIDSAAHVEMCRLCKGSGQYPHQEGRPFARCFVCNGVGYVPVRLPQ
jgi:hypothetical protein